MSTESANTQERLKAITVVLAEVRAMLVAMEARIAAVEQSLAQRWS